MDTRHSPLPIDDWRDAFLDHLGRRPIVLTSPTGSGKSTRVPLWCRDRGPVLVVEPRRVACRGLAAWVAKLAGTALGAGVGYAVRNDVRATRATAVLFATPGVALRLLADGDTDRFRTLVLDEFHERGLETDLLLALIAERRPDDLVVMSATLEADRLAEHLAGVHLSSAGRLHAVRCEHVAEDTALPDVGELDARLAKALSRAWNDPGDILVFLPGKGEIKRVAERLGGRDVDVLPLHGALTLAQQSRVFEPTSRRRIVLATNVAETSLTVDGIGVVIDSGLVRRTRYYRNRGYLTLVPIAEDSRDQRTGRAGRTGPGVCYRLWGIRARLEPVTPPAVHREDLAPLILAAAACGRRVEALPFFDPPPDHAVTAARTVLESLGAFDPESGEVSARGRQLFRLPLDAALGRLLVEAEGTPYLEDVVDLVAALAIGRPLFAGDARPADPDDDLRAAGCDGLALIRAIREGRPEHGIALDSVKDARRVAAELRRILGLPEERGAARLPSSEALARLALAADPSAAHVARRRKRGVAWSNGGTELELGRESAIMPEKTEAVAVLATRALGVGLRAGRLLITAGLPLRATWLLDAGLGEDRLVASALDAGRLRVQLETIYAGRTIGTREATPTGATARAAVTDLFLRGRLFRGRRDEAAARVRLRRVLAFLVARELLPESLGWVLGPGEPVLLPSDELGPCVAARLEELGFECAEDLDLLDADDLLPPPLAAPVVEYLERSYPAIVAPPEGHFDVRYDTVAGEATLERRGAAGRAPSPRTLPALEGFRIVYAHGDKRTVLRERR